MKNSTPTLYDIKPTVVSSPVNKIPRFKSFNSQNVVKTAEGMLYLFIL